MQELAVYLKLRFKRLKTTESIIRLSIVLIGISVAILNYDIIATLKTIFIFLSAMILAQLIGNPKSYFSKRGNNTGEDKGRVLFSKILVLVILIVQLILWDRIVSISSLGLGITYGLVIRLIILFQPK